MKNTYWALGAILIIGLGVAFVSIKSGPAENGPIKLGGIMILSGEGASWGEASRNGMALAIEDINKAGGINGRQVEGVYEDDQSQPQTAIGAFNKLTTTDGVKFIIGTNWSDTGLAVKDLAAAAHVVMISPTLGKKDFNESSEYLFNVWPHDFILSAHLADYVYAQGHRHVALFGANDVWVKEQTMHFKQRFEDLGGSVDILFEPPLATTDVRSTASKVMSNKNIDAVVLTTDGAALTVVSARQLRNLGVTVPFYSVTVDNKIVADCAASCEGMIFPTSLTPTAEFEQKYKAKYNREVEIGADSSYDAVMMLAQAMRKTKSTDPDVVKDYLANIKTYQGVSGNLTSDGKRDFVKDFALKIVKNGKAETMPQN